MPNFNSRVTTYLYANCKEVANLQGNGRLNSRPVVAGAPATVARVSATLALTVLAPAGTAGKAFKLHSSGAWNDAWA